MLSRMRRCLFIAAALALVVGARCLAAEFVADIYARHSSKGEMALRGKVYVKGNMIRVEPAIRGAMTVLVTDPKKPCVCFDDTRKIYRVLLEKPEIAMTEAELKKVATTENAGTATLSGYKCRKTEHKFRDTSKGTQVRWYATELCFPIRVEQRVNKDLTVIELRNIKKRAIPTSMFQIPKGYRKVANTAPPPRKLIMATPPKPKL